MIKVSFVPYFVITLCRPRKKLESSIWDNLGNKKIPHEAITGDAAAAAASNPHLAFLLRCTGGRISLPDAADAATVFTHITSCKCVRLWIDLFKALDTPLLLNDVFVHFLLKKANFVAFPKRSGTLSGTPPLLSIFNGGTKMASKSPKAFLPAL